MNRNTCYCGETYGKYGQVSDSECMTTNGGLLYDRGGSNLRNAIYKTKSE